MKQGPPLTLHPRACDRCGACLAVCPHDALRVGRTYLQVDWNRCDGCGACARACPRRAIVLRSRAGAGKGGDHAKPVRRPSTGAKKPAARTGSGKLAPDETPLASTATPRSKSAAQLAAAAAAANKAKSGGAPKRPVKGGSRGGFQWTLLEAIAMLSVTFSAFMVKEAALAWSWVRTLGEAWQIPTRVVVLGLYYAVQIALIVWLVRRRGGDPAAALGLRHENRPWRAILTSAGLVVAGLVATRVIASVYALITREMGLLPQSGTDLRVLFGNDVPGFALAILMVVLVGPAVEEAVFRGALLEGLAARLGAWPAIVAQAALFAAFHRSLWLLLPTFVLGVALGWLAHRQNSLWPAMALHALYNAITVAAAFLVAGGTA